jgi:hypothetical protein
MSTHAQLSQERQFIVYSSSNLEWKVAPHIGSFCVADIPLFTRWPSVAPLGFFWSDGQQPLPRDYLRVARLS